MAVDTKAKRRSIMQRGLGWMGHVMVPDGTVDASDRRALLGLYSGLASGSPAPGTQKIFAKKRRGRRVSR